LKDRALVLRLVETFERDMAVADLHGIHFYVRNAKVTLYGTIRHELDRDLIVSLVRQIPGVKEVVPHLQMADRPAIDSDTSLTLSL
jgi:osmotically-inducible protein OsmY